ncbi:MAG: YopX family protein [Streptococcus parasanguinis]|nr:YopX family protein [Streptococcus parasanguinis]
MIRFRAWHNTWEEMCEVKRIRFDDEGNITTVLVKGEAFGSNAHLEEIELMQSTGLKDKNGKEIFEKDILDYNGRKVIVKWHGSFACFIYEFVDELKSRTAEWQPLYLSYYKFEIVGNSLENPELLEVTE